MDYPVLGRAPDVAQAVAVGYLDASGNFIPADAFHPLPQINARAGILKGTSAFGQTSYGASKCIGGLIEIATGLPAGTIITPQRLNIGLPRDLITTLQTALVHIFEDNPTGSTIADNSTQAIVAADVPKVVTGATITATSGGTGGFAYFVATIPARMTVDAAGKIYVSIASSTASMVFTGTGSLYWRFEYVY